VWHSIVRCWNIGCWGYSTVYWDARTRAGGVAAHFIKNQQYGLVPDRRSRDLEVVVVRRIINLGTGNLEWGGNGKGDGNGEISLRATWDQGGRDPITARRVPSK
jgi:hypothetical protein